VSCRARTPGGSATSQHHGCFAPLVARLRAAAEVHVVHLATDALPDEELLRLLHESAGFVFATGTYWDSWGSPMQRFLERATRFEGGPVWLGKPAAVVVTMHSADGKGVLSRLQGVLCTLGCQIPPMSGMVYSLATHLAIRRADAEPSVPYADFWQIDDFDTLCHNLLRARRPARAWS
jgi:chromate reductase